MTQDELLTSAQEQREEARYAKWSKYIYTSKRRIQRRVLRLERNIAQNINQFKIYRQIDKWFESDLAFLSCWKFSKVDFGKNTFWCDAIYFDDFRMKDNYTFAFSGHTWIGITENTSNQWKVLCSGYFIINGNNKLKSYDLYFYDKDHTIHLSRKAKPNKHPSSYTLQNNKHSHSHNLEQK